MKRTLIQGLVFLLGAFFVAGGVNYGIAFFTAKPDVPESASEPGPDEAGAAVVRERPVGAQARTPDEEDDPLGMVIDPLESDDEGDPQLLPVDQQNSLTLKVVRERVAELRLRQSQLKLILHDYRAEQDLVGKLRQLIDDRIELATREMVATGQLVEGDQPAFGALLESTTATPAATLIQPETAQTGLRRIAQLYDRMPEGVPAEIFVQMAADGLEDTVVLILSVMNDRSMARILGDIASQDVPLASRLTEALGQSEDESNSETDSADGINKSPEEADGELKSATG